MRIKLLEHLLCWEDDIFYEGAFGNRLATVDIVGWVEKKLLPAKKSPFHFAILLGIPAKYKDNSFVNFWFLIKNTMIQKITNMKVS